MKSFFRFVFLNWLIAVSGAFAGTVNIANSFVGSMAFNEVIDAHQYKMIPLGQWRTGDKLEIQIGARNSVFNDITACILTEDEARNFQPRGGCRGRVKTMTPFMLQWQVDMADQFATVSLLRAGDRGRELLLQWKQYWTQQDSRAEAQNQLERGDTHSLSIQRARNIQNWINFPDELTHLRQWSSHERSWSL